MWNEYREIPTFDGKVSKQDIRSYCNEALAALRGARQKLFPSPDPEIDLSLNEWIRRGELVVGECPLGDGNKEAHQAALREVVLVRTEIDAALNFLRSSHKTKE